jgi:pyruvate-ferredoxin/flavodoxin oxidoreductase
MFKYNADKMAYIADAKAGTFSQLVDAAELCPVAVIHPGSPLDPNEPDLDDLTARAEKFS